MPPDSVRGEAGILKVTAWVDGASRGNPGPAGYGVFMKTAGGETIEASGYIGRTTNNIAEYSGLLEALNLAKEEGATDVEIISDSELLVRQMLGVYKVRNPGLLELYQQAKKMARHFPQFTIRHTLRAGNRDADRLANDAVDRGEGRRVERRR